VPDNSVMCGTASTPSRCADATHSTTCSHWVQQTETCTFSGSTTACDATSGTCLLPPPCNPSFPFIELCAGGDNKWTKGSCSTGYASLAPCARCTPTVGGVSCGGDGR
jgi:hypothetical protein